ncbi:unannotated protein [freshwater metagenome]|uniref:Unannotated protein n=1 Tax=freshwater metagenome TaxID=449393 RepID=A0A6J6HNC8_9ZZZZ
MTVALNSVAILSPTESPTNSIAPTAPASNGAPNIGVTPNHGDGRSNAVRKLQPDIFTEPVVPVTVTSTA